MIDSFTTYGSSLLGGSWPVVWALIKIVALVRAADGLRRLPHAVGAQGHRLDADPARARTASAPTAC